MSNQLSFNSTALTILNRNNQIWLTSSELAKALNYANSRAITMIFNKHKDEFSLGMSEVLESSTSGNLRVSQRIFSLRGAHLIAMFSRTTIAKEFRKWVLDILDKEVGVIQPHSQPKTHTITLTDNELCNLLWLWRIADLTLAEIRYAYPAMKAVESPRAGRFYSMGHEYPYTVKESAKTLKRITDHLQISPVEQSNWRVIHELRQL